MNSAASTPSRADRHSVPGYRDTSSLNAVTRDSWSPRQRSRILLSWDLRSWELGWAPNPMSAPERLRLVAWPDGSTMNKGRVSFIAETLQSMRGTLQLSLRSSPLYTRLLRLWAQWLRPAPFSMRNGRLERRPLLLRLSTYAYKELHTMWPTMDVVRHLTECRTTP